MLKAVEFTKEKILKIFKLKWKGEPFFKFLEYENVQSEEYTQYEQEIIVLTEKHDVGVRLKKCLDCSKYLKIGTKKICPKDKLKILSVSFNQ